MAPTNGARAGASASSSAQVNAKAPDWVNCHSEATKLLQDHTPAGFSYECATIEVPQDWAHADNGKTFHIALLRARSNRQHDRIGSLVVNPGGPGEPGIGLAIDLSLELPSSVLQRFDIVGFDPRAVGKSDPVKC